MKNELLQFPNQILSQMTTLRKITSTDKFPCFSCFDDRMDKITCKVCLGSGFIYGSHPMVLFSEDFIEKKINYLRKQEEARKNLMQNERNNMKMNSSIQSARTDKGGRFEQDSHKNPSNQKLKNVSIEIEHNQSYPSTSNDPEEVTKSKMISSESQDEQVDFVMHYGFCCDQCHQDPIEGHRYHCKICEDYDLCCKCFKKNLHSHEFVIFKQNQNANRSSIHPSHQDMLKSIRKSLRKMS